MDACTHEKSISGRCLECGEVFDRRASDGELGGFQETANDVPPPVVTATDDDWRVNFEARLNAIEANIGSLMNTVESTIEAVRLLNERAPVVADVAGEGA